MTQKAEMDAIVHAFAVGFVTVNRQSVESPSKAVGSGTLVDFNGIKGVVTAAHVTDYLKSLSEFGILRFRPDRRFEGLTCSGDELEVVKIGGAPYGSSGADLAFIRLPHRVEAALSASNAFFNSRVRGMALQNGMRPSNISLRFVTGIVAELTKQLDPIGNMRRVEYASIHAVGDILSYEVDDDEIDRLEFEIFHSESFPPPTSYGGVSGGGLWQLGQSDHPIDKSFCGVAYYQSDAKEGGERTLRCHGPSAVHEVLYLAVLDRFAPDLAAEHRSAAATALG